MALLLSTTANTITSPRKTPPFLATGTPKQQITAKSLQKRSKNLSPLRVAAPPSSPAASDEAPVRKDEKEDYGSLIDDEFGEESSDSKFSWRDHWYPVSLVEDLDQNSPTPFQLLGRDLVLWFDNNSNKWVAFDDKCPHRLAPLSVIFSILLFLLLSVIWWSSWNIEDKIVICPFCYLIFYIIGVMEGVVSLVACCFHFKKWNLEAFLGSRVKDMKSYVQIHILFCSWSVSPRRASR